jgi:hypothetical protein
MKPWLDWVNFNIKHIHQRVQQKIPSIPSVRKNWKILGSAEKLLPNLIVFLSQNPGDFCMAVCLFSSK